MTMRKAPTRLAVGVAWYRAEDWERLRQLCPDRDKMHDRYEDWRAEAMRAEQAMKHDGYTVLRVVIDPDELTGWCAIRGLTPIQDVRAQYVSERVQQGGRQRR
jgi:hypothetical protein